MADRLKSKRRTGFVPSAPSAPPPGRLELFLPPGWPERSGAIRWRWRDRQGSVDDLQQLPPGARQASTQVWTPAGETLLLRARLPTRSRAKIAQALPYALEEQLLDPPGELHFAFVPEADGSLAVAVTRRARLKAWLAALAAARLRIAQLSPAVLSLPLLPDAWSLAFLGDEVALRTGRYSGFGGPAQAQPPAWLAHAMTEARELTAPPVKLLAFDMPPDFAQGAWEALAGVPVEPASAQALPRQQVSLNLLQGEFAPRGRWTDLARPYLPAAALIALWLIGGVAAGALEWANLWRTQRAAEAEMHALFTASFPETKTVLDPARQMQKQAEQLMARSGTSLSHDFLPLWARALPLLQGETGARLETLSYAERSLTLGLAAADAGSIEALARRLRAAALHVDEQSGTRRGAQFEARLILRADTGIGTGRGAR
jgi:general secretion pathway protein L